MSNATVSGSLISNLLRASDTREILPGPLQSSFSDTFYADYPSCAGFTPKKTIRVWLGFRSSVKYWCFSRLVWPMWRMLITLQGNGYFLSKSKRKEVQYQENDVVCRLLAQTTLRNILGTKNLHEILSDRESISSSMQVVFFFLYLFLFARKMVGQLGTNMVKRTTYWMMDDIDIWYWGVISMDNIDCIDILGCGIYDLNNWCMWYIWQKMLDEATEPWGIKVERVEM